MIHCLNASYSHNMYSCKPVSVFLFLTILLITSKQSSANSDRIRLEDVDHITFAIDKNITSRRASEPVSQLECIGGSNQCKWLPEVVDCSNRGFDRSRKTVLWYCNTDMHLMSEDGKVQVVKFNQTLVICEGYNSPTDEYIFLASCRLQYSIDTLDGRLHYNSFLRHFKDNIILSIIIYIVPSAILLVFVVWLLSPFCFCKRKRKPSIQIVYESGKLLNA